MDASFSAHGERTDQGREFVLRPRGFGRFVSAAFLAFWLCFWVIGEALVLFILIAGAIALVTGTPPGQGRAPIALGPALACGAFLLFWLALWTLGGYAALGELLRLLWSKDRIIAGPASLRVVHRLGPFRSDMEFSRDTIRRIYVVPGDNTLRAETDTGPIVLSNVGSPIERAQVASGLREELRVPEECAIGAAPSLPEGWQEIVTPEGEVALVKDLALRRKQAGVALGITLPLVAISLVIVTLSWNDPKLIPLAVMVCTAAAGAAWGTVRLARSRIEWRIASGSLIGRRRSGSHVRDFVEASRLELVRSSDSDGDDSFALEAMAKGAVEAQASWRRPGRRTIERTIRDPAVPRRLGAWIAERTKLPFDNRATPAALRIDGERALAELRETGAFGRRLADWIERVTAARRGSGS